MKRPVTEQPRWSRTPPRKMSETKPYLRKVPNSPLTVDKEKTTMHTWHTNSESPYHRWRLFGTGTRGREKAVRYTQAFRARSPNLTKRTIFQESFSPTSARKASRKSDRVLHLTAQLARNNLRSSCVSCIPRGSDRSSICNATASGANGRSGQCARRCKSLTEVWVDVQKTPPDVFNSTAPSTHVIGSNTQQGTHPLMFLFL